MARMSFLPNNVLFLNMTFELLIYTFHCVDF